LTKKIGVFCPTLNVLGGGEYVAIALANTLAQSNHSVILFANAPINSQAIQNYFGEPLHPTIKTIVQSTNFTARGLGDFYQTIVHSYIAKAKCDLFVDAFSNCVFPWTQVSYIHFPYLNQYAFSKTFPYLGSHRISQAATLPHVILEKNLIDYTKRLVLANSFYTAGEIRKFSGKPVEVLYPPFSASISKLGKESSKSGGENLVVTVSRLEPSKLLDRIPKIAALTDPKTQFAIVGRLCSQPTLSSLQDQVKKLGLTDRVKFYPDASAQVKTDLLMRAKIYLHTMEGEHFGISIVEAMALGCLPIVHNSGGMTEFAPLDYRYETLQEAADKINRAIEGWSPKEADAMKQIADRFSTAKFSERFNELFNKMYD
jgi:glycosyltransferase involved in cell wall biosynthesis